MLDLLHSAIIAGREFCNKQDSCAVCEYKKFELQCLEAYWCEWLKQHGAVEVVRCKDCRYLNADYKCVNWRGLYDYTKADDFCSYGERREDA